MKPKPFSPLNHFTVPCAMYESSLQVLDLRTVRGPADLTAPGERRPFDAVSRPPTVPAGACKTRTPKLNDLTTQRGAPLFRSPQFGFGAGSRGTVVRGQLRRSRDAARRASRWGVG